MADWGASFFEWCYLADLMAEPGGMVGGCVDFDLGWMVGGRVDSDLGWMVGGRVDSDLGWMVET